MFSKLLRLSFLRSPSPELQEEGVFPGFEAPKSSIPTKAAVKAREDAEDERDERVGERHRIFKEKFASAFSSACKMDERSRGHIHILEGVSRRALPWMPGEPWKGPSEGAAGYGLSVKPRLLCMHVDDFNDQYSDKLKPLAKGRDSLLALIEGGNSLLLLVPDKSHVPEFVKDFSHSEVTFPNDLFELVMRTFRSAAEDSAFPPFLPFLPHYDDRKECELSKLIDQRGRIRGNSGWVSIKAGPQSLALLLIALSHMMTIELFDVEEILRLATSGICLGAAAPQPDPAKPGSEVDDTPSLAEMPGIRRVRKRVTRVLARSSAGQKKGILLYGPPGTGKTMLARSIAKETKRTLVATSFAEWQSSGDGHLGTTLGSMKASFDKAKAQQPAVLFIDELDSLVSRGSGGKNDVYMRAVVNSFLALMDGFKERGDILVVGATNYKDALDPAMLRHGRFGDHLEMPLPDMTDVSEIVEWYLQSSVLPNGRDPDVTGRALSLRFFSESAATIRAMVEEAVALSTEEGGVLRLFHFERAMIEGRAQGEEASASSVETLLNTAMHEAGHALAMRLLFGRRAKIALATNRPGLSSLGHVVYEFVKEREPVSVADHAALVMVALAGRSAEIAHGGMGALGFGAGSDLKKARRLAQYMVEAGCLPSRADVFVDVGDKRAIRKAADEWLVHLHGETTAMLAAHEITLRAVGRAIYTERDLDESQLSELFSAHGVEEGVYPFRC